ncbi:MAG TPA: ComF family protein [Clostridia bacterium]|nr:ComF family protein [Clostridia bacterium]
MSSQWIRRVLAILFPERCAFCGSVISPGRKACAACEGQLPFVTGEICLNCGRAKTFCVCGHKKREYSGCVVPFYYEGPAKKGIRRLKYSRRVSVAPALAGYAAPVIVRKFGGADFDFVTFVPMSTREKKSRGFNQSELFASALARMLDLPCLDVMTKPFENRPQHDCAETERWGNVFGAFEVREGSAVEGKTILLCDDVVTTGATLNECAKMLRLSGAKKVFCSAAACVKKRGL